MCDMEIGNIEPNSTLNVETGTRTVSVLVDPNGFLNCSAKQMFDGYSIDNSTHGPSNAFNKTIGGCFAVSLFKGLNQRNFNSYVFGFTEAEPQCLVPVIYGTSAALICLILMALLAIWHLRPRLCAGRICSSLSY